ncbi:MAG: RNA methyltransferase [Syntrophales bacterium]|nr:RNA methyltransferase [Syntrophales bacterium]
MSYLNNLYIALLHHPAYNKNGEVVTTAVTNLDLHDISRVARTYGANRFYIITPLKNQREFVEQILSHWQRGYGASCNPMRKEAFDITSVRTNLSEVRDEITRNTGNDVFMVATSASKQSRSGSYEELRKMMKNLDLNFLVLFGTGWGLAKEVLQQADLTLEPIEGPTDYNHLSVRSAVSIVMDRLMGRSST